MPGTVNEKKYARVVQRATLPTLIEKEICRSVKLLLQCLLLQSWRVCLLSSALYVTDLM